MESLPLLFQEFANPSISVQGQGGRGDILRVSTPLLSIRFPLLTPPNWNSCPLFKSFQEGKWQEWCSQFSHATTAERERRATATAQGGDAAGDVFAYTPESAVCAEARAQSSSIQTRLKCMHPSVQMASAWSAKCESPSLSSSLKILCFFLPLHPQFHPQIMLSLIN